MVAIVSPAAVVLALTAGVSLIMVLIDWCVLLVLLTYSWVASEVALSLDDAAGTWISLESLDSIYTRWFSSFIFSKIESCNSSASRMDVSSSSGSFTRSMIC